MTDLQDHLATEYISVRITTFSRKPTSARPASNNPFMPALSPVAPSSRPEFIERVRLFTGLSRSLLEGAMAGFMDELRDCLAPGWTVELG